MLGPSSRNNFGRRTTASYMSNNLSSLEKRTTVQSKKAESINNIMSKCDDFSYSNFDLGIYSSILK